MPLKNGLDAAIHTKENTQTEGLLLNERHWGGACAYVTLYQTRTTRRRTWAPRRPTRGDPGFTDAARLNFILRPDSLLQPRADKLLTRTITEVDIARVRAYFAWVGFTQPLAHRALTPPRQ